MISLEKDLQTNKNSLDKFGEITKRNLTHLNNVISDSVDKNDYIIYSSINANTIKYVRPINRHLFINDINEFEDHLISLKDILNRISKNAKTSKDDNKIIDRTIYTIQQSIGAGLDLVANPNSARKHMGNRFEELITVIFSEIGIANKKLILQIPYDIEDGTKTYKCENDLVLSPFNQVRSSTSFLHKDEIVVSIKTTSKDRMGKMFIDKILLERFIKHPQKVIGIFLNDVQRKETNNISFTLVSGLFMVYSKFLTKLDGIYYLDPPPNATKPPFSEHMSRFSDLITRDIGKLLSP